MAIQRQKIINEIESKLPKDQLSLFKSFVVCEQQRDCLVFRMPESVSMLDDIWETIKEVCISHKVICRKEGRYANLEELDQILGNVKWLWKNWLPIGSLSLLVGDPGSNKSMLAMDLAKTVANGGKWPMTEDVQEPGNVVWIEAEAGHQMLRQRANAMGLDKSRVWLGNFDGDVVAQPDLLNEQHQGQLKELVKAKKPELIIIDSLSGINQRGENKVEEVRPILQFLADLARDEQSSILMIHHLRKSSPGESIEIELNKVRGSGAIVAFSRSIIGLEKQETRRIVRHVKGNYAPPQRPIVASPAYENAGTDKEKISILYAEFQSPAPKVSKVEKCAEWIVSLIRQSGNTEVPLSEIILKGEAEGYSRGNIYNAKDFLVDQISVTGTGKQAFWSLVQDTEAIYQVSMMYESELA